MNQPVLAALMLLIALQKGRPVIRSGDVRVGPSLSPADSDCGVLTAQVCDHFKDGITIFGKLIWPTDLVPAIIDVELEDDGGIVVDSVQSGPNNEFQFHNVPVLGAVGNFRTYYIVVNTDGLDIVRQELSPTTNNFTGALVDIPLRRPPGISAKSLELVTSFGTLLQQPPAEAVNLLDRALADERKGDSKKAAMDLKAALKIAPDFYEANLELGILQKNSHQTAVAKYLLPHAIEVNPSSMRARVALGQQAFDARNFKQAGQMLSEAVVVGSSSADVYLLLGSALYELGDLDAAEMSLQRALAIAPGLGQANRELYAVYLKLGDLDKALEQLQTYLKMHPTAPDRDKVESLVQKLQKAVHP